jgi:hypothetical protein
MPVSSFLNWLFVRLQRCATSVVLHLSMLSDCVSAAFDPALSRHVCSGCGGAHTVCERASECVVVVVWEYLCTPCEF